MSATPQPDAGETLLPAPSASPVRTPTSSARPVPAGAAPAERSTGPTGGFAEETRSLLRRRLLLTHAAFGVVALGLTVSDLSSMAVLPPEFGLGRWAVGVPLLVFGHSLAGLLFLLRSPEVPLRVLRIIEVSQFATLAVAGGLVRFVALLNDPADSPDPHHAELVYRYAGAISNFPFIFGVVLYGTLIPNTRRRSLQLAGALCAVPVLVTAIAALANPHVRPTMPAVVPLTVLPLMVAFIIAVFSAARTDALRHEVYAARREAGQVGSYALLRLLGKGGMGEVWLAEHRLLKRPCAVKFIRADLAANPAAAARFEREVRSVTGLSHLNTVRVYDYGRADDGSFYYVMEYLEGATLDALVRDAGPLPPARVVYLLRQVCGALAEAHAAGLVHRDLKPGNILVARMGGQHDVAKLLDFGLVQDLGATSADDRLTEAGTVLGTPAYMCPEQAGGEPGLDGRGDVYSLGVVAFFALAGRPPFEATTVGKLLAAHLTQEPPRVDALGSAVPRDLADVIARCLAKSPADRYQSAAELERALAGCACAADWDSVRAAELGARPCRPTGTHAGADATLMPGTGETA